MVFNLFGWKKHQEPVNKDALVIAQLKKHGSKLDQPHRIDFFFYVADEGAATSLAQVLSQDGFSSEIHPANESGQFCVQGIKTMVPDLKTFAKLTPSLENLAKQYGGVYDGWGTEIV